VSETEHPTEHANPSSRPNRTWEQLRTQLDRHLALATSFVVIVAVIIRVTWVSHFDATTAAAIVRYQSASGVVVGAAASIARFLLYFIIVTGGIWLIAYLRWHWHDDHRWRDTKFVGAAITLFAAVMLGLAFFQIILFVSMLVVLTYNAFARPRDLSDEGRAEARFYYVLLNGLVLLQVVLLGSQMWLPAERLTLGDEGLKTGYVLADDGKWMAVLDDDTRLVQLLHSESVTERSICYPRAQREGRTVVEMLFRDRPRYPNCPEPSNAL
jgi:hypothetical protein